MDSNALLLRIFLGEADKHGHEALYKHVVAFLHARGLAGATVLRGLMGFGARRALHAASPLRLAQDLPVVIEVVDEAARVEAVLPDLRALVPDGLITTEDVRVYRRP